MRSLRCLVGVHCYHDTGRRETASGHLKSPLPFVTGPQVDNHRFRVEECCRCGCERLIL